MKRIAWFLALVALRGLAHGEPDADQRLLMVDAGLASVVGYLGVTYSEPLPGWWRADLGVGVGDTGTQLSGMLEYVWRRREEPISPRFPGWGMAQTSLSSGLGVAASVPRRMEHGSTDLWLNADLLVATARIGAFALQFAVGATMELHGDAQFCRYFYDDGCSPNELTDLTHVVLPQARLGVGVAL